MSEFSAKMLWVMMILTSTFQLSSTAVLKDHVTVDISKELTVQLTCPTRSEDEFVLWFYRKNNDKPENEIGFSDRYFFPSLRQVEIRELTESDSGFYICRNPTTNAAIKEIELKISDSSKQPASTAPVWDTIPNPYQTMEAGNQIILPCKAKGENVIVKTFRLDDSGNVKYELGASGVVIAEPTAEDSGSYLCTAENKAGKLSHPFTLIVKVNGGLSNWGEWGACDVPCGFGFQTRERTCDNPPPANGGSGCTGDLIQRQHCRERACSAPHLVKFGYDMSDGDLKLFCKATGIPTPTAEWKVGGLPLPIDQYAYLNGDVVIPKAKAQSGSYSCTVKNTSGYFTMYITIRK